MKTLQYIYILFIVLALAACESLDVPNLNEPDFTRTINSPADLEKVAEGNYLNFWNSTHALQTSIGVSPSIQINLEVAADQFTASWRNFGWLSASLEPRIAWNNSVISDDDKVSESFYYACYGVITQTNTVIKKITKDNMKLGLKGKNNNRLLALSYFIRGATYGNLSLVYDKSFFVDENTVDVYKLVPLPYNELLNKAIESLTSAINICDTATFTLPGDIFNSADIPSDQFKRIVHSYIAKFIVLNSRNKLENNEVDWNIVLDHTNKGITSDFGSNFNGLPYEGGGGTWYDLNVYYLVLRDWARVDNRILNLLDPAYPKKYWSTGKPLKVHSALKVGQASSSDYRLSTDFEYLSSVNFEALRGIYHYSNYRYKRLDNFTTNSGSGTIMELRQYENDLYKAEAYAMLGNLTASLKIINDENNPRYVRGHLNVFTSISKSDVLKVIFYERDIELMAQGFMLGFCDMRRRDMLQFGTPLHLPIPGKELQTLQLPYYTYGGPENADGSNTSSGGWFDANGN
jgi:hypothetical protein